MGKFRVSVTRTTWYEIDARTEDEAVDDVLDGLGKEIDGETNSHTVEAVCDDDASAQADTPPTPTN